MGRVGRTATVAADEQLLARAQALLDQLCCSGQLRFKIDQRLESLCRRRNGRPQILTGWLHAL
jgi:hypothetical protein